MKLKEKLQNYIKRIKTTLYTLPLAGSFKGKTRNCEKNDIDFNNLDWVEKKARHYVNCLIYSNEITNRTISLIFKNKNWAINYINNTFFYEKDNSNRLKLMVIDEMERIIIECNYQHLKYITDELRERYMHCK